APKLREAGYTLLRLTDEGVQTEPTLPRGHRGDPGGAIRVVVQRGRRVVYDALSIYWVQNRQMSVQMVWDRRGAEARGGQGARRPGAAPRGPAPAAAGGLAHARVPRGRRPGPV